MTHLNESVSGVARKAFFKTESATPITDDAANLLESLYVFQQLGSDNLTEAVNLRSLKAFLVRQGVKTKKAPGLLQTVLKGGVNTAKLMNLAIKTSLGKPGAADELQKLKMSSKITKKTVLDFLFRLDVVSLHLFSGPIHSLDALFGWDLAHIIEKHVKAVTIRVKTALDTLRRVAAEQPDPMKSDLFGSIGHIHSILNVA